jgi:FKBP-type peptidyl-prolyl cis-trans isomerase
MTQSASDKFNIQDLVVGDGNEARSGDIVTVHYVGTLEDGTEFDSSKRHGQPFTFRLGMGDVIAGWEMGIPGMKVGGKRKLVIPPSYGYGNNAVGSIPAGSTLVFEVELISIG